VRPVSPRSLLLTTSGPWRTAPSLGVEPPVPGRPVWCGVRRLPRCRRPAAEGDGRAVRRRVGREPARCGVLPLHGGRSGVVRHGAARGARRVCGRRVRPRVRDGASPRAPRCGVGFEARTTDAVSSGPASPWTVPCALLAAAGQEEEKNKGGE